MKVYVLTSGPSWELEIEGVFLDKAIAEKVGRKLELDNMNVGEWDTDALKPDDIHNVPFWFLRMDINGNIIREHSRNHIDIGEMPKGTTVTIHEATPKMPRRVPAQPFHIDVLSYESRFAAFTAAGKALLEYVEKEGDESNTTGTEAGSDA